MSRRGELSPDEREAMDFLRTTETVGAPIGIPAAAQASAQHGRLFVAAAEGKWTDAVPAAAETPNFDAIRGIQSPTHTFPEGESPAGFFIALDRAFLRTTCSVYEIVDKKLIPLVIERAPC